MKKIFSFLTILVFAGLVACNNESKKTTGSDENPEAKVDSLKKEVDEGHDIAMPKSMKIPALQKEARRLIDSIAALPAKAREAAAPYKEKLETLVQELGYAETAMDKWMIEYRFDSTFNNLEQKIKYFTEEKLKVDKVKEAVLNSVQKADSLFKARF